ncbi:MAG TPA: tRNA pseudouridine(55) synthase TruB [Myxococcota bacterium]|nr:tRNA pseudouridine(55) synthase TruB [Myxococcota bacterium]
MIDGFLVIDKPRGLTSHDVVQRVRRIAKQRRVGHLGTLDPLATGVLPIALGEATKLSQLLTHGAKSYRGTLLLGVETTTYDREGEVVATREGPWPARAVLEKALSAFEGEIEQVPPPYSAVKQDGQAAYKRARRGEAVVLEPRRVSISRVLLTHYEPPYLSIEVDCSAGTYLRSMAHDLGGALGTGAHLYELCRTRSGPFTLDQAVSLEALEAPGAELAARLIPMLAATGLPTFDVDARVARRMRNGVQLGRHELRGVPTEGVLQLAHAGKLVALVEAQRGIPELRTIRVFVAGTEP